jgi:alkylhydroperoxidase/carboxymuconolactone decarboxylase family protein YurZ
MPDRKLPESQLAAGELEALQEVYRELLGFVPPRITARTDLLGRLDPEGLRLQEEMRSHFMYPRAFDTKTVQLMLFGMLLMNLQDAAKLHAIAARRAGASWEELVSVMGLAYIFRGLSAANVGSQILQEVAADEDRGRGEAR